MALFCTQSPPTRHFAFSLLFWTPHNTCNFMQLWTCLRRRLQNHLRDRPIILSRVFFILIGKLSLGRFHLPSRTRLIKMTRKYEEFRTSEMLDGICSCKFFPMALFLSGPLRQVPYPSLVASNLTSSQNIDRRPPTLLKQFTLLQNVSFSKFRAPSHLHVLPGPTKHTLALVSTAPLSVHMLEPLNFFDSHSDGLTLLGRVYDYMTDGESRIKQFVRTPDGTGLAVVRETGGDAWIVRDHGTSLQRTGKWTTADNVVVLNGGKLYLARSHCRYLYTFSGRSLATFSNATCLLTLHTTPELTLSLPPISSLFSLPSKDIAPYECIYAISADLAPTIFHIHAVSGELPSLSVVSQTALPLPSPVAFILPVDPMGWISSRDTAGTERDVLLSVGRDGELMFWVPDGNGTGWHRTGRVRTGRTSIRMARCSSAKKTVLSVSPSLTIHPARLMS